MATHALPHGTLERAVGVRGCVSTPALVEQLHAAPPYSSRPARGQRFSWLASPALAPGVAQHWCWGRGARAVRIANRWAAKAAHAGLSTSSILRCFTI